MLKNYIQYFKSCYQTDFRAVSLLNFFSSKVQQHLILESAELLQGKNLQFPVSTKWGIETKELLKIYSKEKQLYCCSFFVFGKSKIGGKTQKVVAPLFLYPANLVEEDEVYFLSIESENSIINPAVLNVIENCPPGMIELLIEKLPNGFIQFDEIFQIEKVLKELLPQINITLIEKYPTLFSDKEIRELYGKRKSTTAFIVPAVGMCLLDKPTGSRGILNELQAISLAEDFSKPIQTIFGKSENEIIRAPDSFSVPVVLSKSQESILRSAFSNTLTLVIGPPGTGKSFTIAALAVELMCEGKSVLIASKNNQAGNVIADKIEKDFGLKEIVVRAGNQGYKIMLQKRLQDLLRGIGLVSISSDQVANLQKKTTAYNSILAQRETQIKSRTKKEMRRGEFLFAYSNNLFQKMRRFFLEKKINNEPKLWTQMFLLEKDLLARNKLLKKLIKTSYDYHLFKALINSRVVLQRLVKALRARTGNRKESIFNNINFQEVTDVLPVWVVNAIAVHKVLPLERELFDVVIVDEATQCDIASSIPLLQRAKSAVIVGDPKQLRHISFLSQKQQLNFFQKFKLDGEALDLFDYRKKSLLDLASDIIKSQSQVHFLDEHFRSMPDIIEFSNHNFYSNKLHIMTACPTTKLRQHSFLCPTNGKRNESGVNEIEAHQILDQVKSLIDSEKEFSDNLCKSIGILSPFRNQVEYFKKVILEMVSLSDLDRHRILIGTPFDFQGEEKEIMFISFVLDNETHPSAFIYLNRPDVFNVSITRARSQQYHFISFDLKKPNPKSLMAQYISFLKSKTKFNKNLTAGDFQDEFLEEVQNEIFKMGIQECHTAFQIAGTEIDLVAVKNNKTYCIDLVGYPGEFEAALPLERWRMLERVGISTFTLPYSAWYFHKEKCIKTLKRFLEIEIV